MIQSAVTVSLVPQAKGGPFVFWNGLADAFQQAEKLGFDAVEIFAPGPDAVDRDELRALVAKHKLTVAAVGTGAGMVISGLSLTDASDAKRREAISFIKSMIDFGAEFNAPAIIGSMQGRWGGDMDKATALSHLRQALNELGRYAESKNVTLIYEPLNRYESNLLNTIADTVEFMDTLESENVKLLADLFHMNIEEANVAEAIRQGAKYLGHVHFVDSNRQAAGLGHTDFDAVAKAIKETQFEGFLSIEAFPLPNPTAAATKSIESFKRLFSTESTAV